MENDPKRPTPETTVETDDATELLAFERRFDLIQQLSNYAEAAFGGQIKSGLLPYQVPAFADTVKFFEKHAQGLTTADQLTISGYLDLPTSFGKSVIMAKLAEAFGIGKVPEGRTRKRKALILVPTQQAVEQTIGQLDEDGNGGGFAKHAPGVSVGGYYQHGKNLDADVTAMTYLSFLAFIRRIASGEIADPDFDIIMCDEAQHTLGSEISMALDAYRQGKIAIALTATPEFDSDRTIKHMFTECIHKSELLPLIEVGVLNGVQLIGLATGNLITTSGRGDFTEAELGSLVSNNDRNATIVEMAKQLVAEGRRGVVNALKGQRAGHAIMLADILNGQKVMGEDGELITVRAEAISSFLNIEERRRILREYKEGKIHILTQVQALNENWDEDDVGFIINAAPTASKVVAYQRIGRGMRPNGDWPITVIVELMDDIMGRKRAVTAWNVFGEDEYEQGKVFTTPERRERTERERNTGQKRHMGATVLGEQDVTPSSDPQGSTAESADQPADWSPEEPVHVARPGAAAETTAVPQPASAEQPVAAETQRRLTFDLESLQEGLRIRLEDFTMRVARELTIKQQEVIGPPKPGWIELVSLAGIGQQKGMGIFAMRSAIVNEGGFKCELAETPVGDRYYVERGAQQFIIDYEPVPWAPSTHKSIADMERELGMARQLLEPIIDGLVNQPNARVKGKPMRSPILKRKLKYFSPAEYRIIKSRVNEVKSEMPQEGEDIVFLSQLAKETKVVRGPIQFFLIRHHGIKGDERRSPTTSQKGMAYTRAEADIARFHFSHQEIPKRAKLLEYLEQATGLSEDVIRTRIEERHLEDIIKKGRFADARGDYHYTLFCTEEDFDRAVRLLTEKIATPAPQAPAAKPTSSPPPLPTPAPAAQSTPPPPASRPAVSSPRVARRPEILLPSSTAVSYMELLRDLRCNPAAARYLLRQLPFAGGAVRNAPSGEQFIELEAATMLRRRCNDIGPPPRTSRSDRYFAERFGCRLTDIHAILTTIMPEPSQVGLFRTDDGTNVITFHYMARLASQIEHVLRQRFGMPQ